MEIIAKAVHVIDYEADRIRSINPPEEFEGYVEELIQHITDNTTVRQYVSTGHGTEAVACILDIKQHAGSEEIGRSKMEMIAKRLLRVEKAAQQRVEHLDIRVQKGSLVQALLLDNDRNESTYLLAKVEHGGFVDDADFSIKSGFSKDKKTIWKSCIFNLANVEVENIPANLYSNTSAKYWWSDFLELAPVIDDTQNTQNAFKAIDHTLRQLIRDNARYDHTILRNAFVSYFKKNNHLDYDVMIGDILDQYTPTDLSPEKLASLRHNLMQLPDERKFDRQFNAIPSAITARIKSVYDVYQGIKLQITDEVENIEDVISADRDEEGHRFIKVMTTDDATYNRFHKRECN